MSSVIRQWAGEKKRRSQTITKLAEKAGWSRRQAAQELKYAEENGIPVKTYMQLGYWNIPHDQLLEAHTNDAHRKDIAQKLVERRSGNKTVEAVERDMIEAKYKYGLRYGYFKNYGWDRLTDEQKEQMLLRPHSEQMSMKYRLPDANSDFLDDKQQLYTAFPDLIKRKWMHYEPSMTLEEFQEKTASFTSKEVIYKPDISSGGHGIEKFSLEGGTEALYKQLQEEVNEPALIEECLLQHPEMARLCSDSINTVRVVVLYWEGEYHLLYTVCRMGAGNGKPVDNVSRGGWGVAVDPETGQFNTVAANHRGRSIREHPVSGVELKGFQIPYWTEVLELVKKAAIRTYELAGLGYTGWDIAITPDGPAIIEGNNWPSPSLVQLAYWKEQKKGMKYLFEPYL
ncbi:MAG: hypothetical protein IJI74_05580 [Firmicutes bacterium]|nr:hypothetical protein [Bacillota bacterium]